MNRDRTELVPDGGAADPSLTAPPRAEEIDTETKVIGSRDLAGRVADALRLADDPAFVAQATHRGLGGRLRRALGVTAAEPADRRSAVVDALLARVDAARLDNAYAIRISYSDPDPARAAQIANAFAEAYTASGAAAKRAENEKALKVLGARIEQLRARPRPISGPSRTSASATDCSAPPPPRSPNRKPAPTCCARRPFRPGSRGG
jgi:uncharacterized protein involved in exopolysaccharide biosynthesis